MGMDCMGLCIVLFVVLLVALCRKISVSTKLLQNSSPCELTWLGVASCKRITYKTIATYTYWTMIIDATICIYSAYSGTRIFAFLVDTGLVGRTFRARDTFRPTSRRGTYVFWQAGAHCLAIYLTTLTVWTTRRWATWVNRVMNNCCSKSKITYLYFIFHA